MFCTQRQPSLLGPPTPACSFSPRPVPACLRACLTACVRACVRLYMMPPCVCLCVGGCVGATRGATQVDNAFAVSSSLQRALADEASAVSAAVSSAGRGFREDDDIVTPIVAAPKTIRRRGSYAALPSPRRTTSTATAAAASASAAAEASAIDEAWRKAHRGVSYVNVKMEPFECVVPTHWLAGGPIQVS